MKSRSPGADFPLVLVALALSVYGVMMVYSSGQLVPVLEGGSGPLPGTSGNSGLWLTQLRWLAVAFVAAWMASRVSLRVVEYMSWPVYLLAIGLLVLTIAGLGSGAGAAQFTTQWLTIAGRRIGQPSELAKIAVVLLLAKVLASRNKAPESLLDLWQPALIMLIPLLLILKQKDLGTALVFLGVFFGMLYWSGVRWQLLLFLASPAVSLVLATSTKLWGIWFILLVLLVLMNRPSMVEVVAVLAANVTSGVVAQIIWDNMGKYRRDRILVFLDPASDPTNAGYNVLQSMTAIGSGHWFGQGFNQGPQKGLQFIPEQQTDFIFAVLGEEMGFIGVCVALGLFLAFFLRTTRIASRANESFSGLVAFGLTSIWVVHVVVNVGMTLSLVPVTGIPLPFFSYGGSFMLACWLAVGLLHRISVDGRGQPDSLAL